MIRQLSTPTPEPRSTGENEDPRGAPRAAGTARGEEKNHLALVGQFATTHWSVVVLAGQQDLPQATVALERLCHAYWYPLYAYVRRQGKSPEDAEDLTQQFFSRLLEKNYLAKADRDRGKFRTFLLASMKNFLVNEWKREGRLKRGGDQSFVSLKGHVAEDRYAAEPIDASSLETAFDQQWANALIDQVFGTLRRENSLARLRGFDPGAKYLFGVTG